jgi:hypothetical protein
MASPERDKPRSLRKDGFARRIENTQSANRRKLEVFSIHGFAGTNVSPYEKMALPERDGVSVWQIEGEQHTRHTNVTTPSIHGFAGTNVSPYEKMASPERDKPR